MQATPPASSAFPTPLTSAAPTWPFFPSFACADTCPQDLLERPAFIDRNHKELKELAAKLPLPAIVGYAGRVKNGHGKSIANKAALINEGRVVFEQSKMLLPTYDVFDESRYFQPADRQSVYGLDNEQLGITICEDVWNDKTFWANCRYDRDPVTEIIAQGTTILLNISASPYTIDKRGLRLEMLRSIAMHHRRPIVYVNQVGGDDSLIFDGASMALTADGRVAAQARAFEEDLVFFDTVTGKGEIHDQPHEEIAYAYQAILTGTYDYVQKCGFKKVLVGLSGGIDSAVVAAIAAEALGPENVLGVSMPGPYSSAGSKTDAAIVAKNLGIDMITVPVGDVFDSYLNVLKPIFGTLAPDVTEENIQARIRGNYLMALSNKFGSMVLSTGNKSELAVGYCTLYGDMAGGLAILSDVPKLMVYELANWINREREVIPESTIRQAAFRRVASRPERRRHPASLRRPRPHSQSLYRRLAQPSGNCRPLWLRSETGTRHCPARRSQRIQAQTSRARTENYFARIRLWPSVSNCPAVYSLICGTFKPAFE